MTTGSANRAQALLAAIVESSDDAILSKTLEGIITSWNAAATRLFGYQADEIVGQSVLQLVAPELHLEEAEILRKLRAGEKIDHYETRRRRKDGSSVDVSLTISPILDRKGRAIGASTIARDISDRRRAEAALIETEKLAATGRMAATIAHEVNNPLEAITNLAYLLTIHPSLDGEAREYARLLLDEVGRASHITKQTLAYYRQSSIPGPVDLAELMDSVLELHRPAMAKKKIELHRLYGGKGIVMAAFASELRQVFTNLILNAIDAVPNGGELRVKITSLARHGGEVRVTVADNGCGIPAQGRARLFEPFFTTKVGRGNGLGLWVSQGIVRKHGGRILVRSSVRPGRSGSVFSVILPSRVKEDVASQAA